MKRISVVSVAFLFIALQSIGQTNHSYLPSETIAPYQLAVSFYKTTNLIFPFSIRSVDMGSPAVMAQKARSVDNILQIKAGKKDFEETNMSVVTSDGAFYSFIINYATAPSPLNISFVKENSLNSLPVQLTQQPLNEAALEATAKKVLQLPAHFFIPAKTGQLKCNLANLLVDTSSMWFSVRLYNSSQINFKPDYLHFSLRDRHQSKRTALQETTLKPIYQSCPPVVSYKTPTWFVFAFKPFTIPPSQRLIIQIGEQSGGRILTLRIKHKALLKATAMVP